MPRYFFHVRERRRHQPRPEGQELPDLEAARREAINTNREMLGEKLLHGGSLNHRQIEIADESGEVAGDGQRPRRAVPGRSVSQLFTTT